MRGFALDPDLEEESPVKAHAPAPAAQAATAAGGAAHDTRCVERLASHVALTHLPPLQLLID